VAHVTELLDEAIHIASAFQIAGLPHVVGTLWAISDIWSAAVADACYAGLRGPRPGKLDTSRVACALHDAVRAARDARPRRSIPVGGLPARGRLKPPRRGRLPTRAGRLSSVYANPACSTTQPSRRSIDAIDASADYHS
jgi:hypothetical protein